jgi:iron complex transport system substrate-binding protein
MRLFFAFALCCLIIGCSRKKNPTPTSFEPNVVTELGYAEGFSVHYQGGNKLVEVKYPFQGATSGKRYLLVQRGAPVVQHDVDVTVIQVPLNSIVCTSTTHIPLLDYLNVSEKLIGFPSTQYVSSPRIRARIDDGQVTELGMDSGLNIERLAMLKPDMVMGYTLTGDYGQFKKIEELNIPVVMNAEYLEKHPLGRAEWIKFMALFFNREHEADSIFNTIENNYLEAKSFIDTTAARPTALSGIVYGDAWFLPGGKNYAAKLLNDAGYMYLWNDNDSHGFLELSFESVYEKAHAADYWIGTGNYGSFDEMKGGDHRYTNFDAFKHKEVYTYDARKGAKGGSEYLELGYLRPDIILKDLIKIAHPDLLPNHSLYFHKQLD